MLNENFILIISGPSGAGKTTVVNLFLQENKDFLLSVSHTTRKKRLNEEEGKHYYFVSKEEFNRMVENNEFVEWAEVYGNYYGTSKSEIERILNNKKNILLEIDVQGAISVKKHFPEESVLVFILPESFSELTNRLISRNTENKEDLEKRLETAKREIEQINFYDYVIINKYGCEKESSNLLSSIVLAEKNRTKRLWDKLKVNFWR
ncbi:MAG: guanylate kinase [Proteobacteria bacterium]|nr:guanylate kinase [Pseudomonadota bacterium]